MRLIRIALHSLALFVADFAGIVLGFMAFKLLGTNHQIAVQLPIAFVLTLLFFFAWISLLRTLSLRGLLPHTAGELPAYWAAALVWGPLVFIPLHYVTQGYATSVANLAAMATYQAPVNLLALLGAWRIQRPRTNPTIPESTPR